MILPDVNLLLYAINRNSPFHDRARDWWNDTASSVSVALCWPVVVGFLRLSTSRRALRNPLSVDEATELVESWLVRPNVALLTAAATHWETLARLLRSTRAGGNLTTDAHIAAFAIDYGCTLASNDADFGRFPGLRWRNPLGASGTGPQTYG